MPWITKEWWDDLDEEDEFEARQRYAEFNEALQADINQTIGPYQFPLDYLAMRETTGLNRRRRPAPLWRMALEFLFLRDWRSLAS